jgi:hypothetical protein
VPPNHQKVQSAVSAERRRLANTTANLTTTAGSYERAINEMIRLARDVGYTFKLNKGSERFPAPELTNISTYKDVDDFRTYHQMFIHRTPKP